MLNEVLNNYGLRDPCKNRYLHFYKTYDHQICQAGTSTGFDSNETNQASAGDVITSRSCEKLKKYLCYQSAHGYRTWQEPIKSHDSFITWSYKTT